MILGILQNKGSKNLFCFFNYCGSYVLTHLEGIKFVLEFSHRQYLLQKIVFFILYYYFISI